MKKIILALFAFTISLSAFAQPANDNCATAQNVVIPGSGNICFTANNNTATTDFTTDACDVGLSGDEIWYTYIAAGSLNTITVTPSGGGGIAATDVVLTMTSTGCLSGTYNVCGSAAGAGMASASWSYTPGTQVWVSIETNGFDGQFDICITSQTPVPAPGNSCGTATTLCDKNPFSVATYPSNASAFSPSCWFPLGTTLQRPIFYQFTVGQTGTCEWTATPQGAAEYDWAMYDITAGCPGTQVACNYHYALDVGAPIGLSTAACQACPSNNVGGAVCREFCAPFVVTAGNTYLIIIDNYAVNTIGFNFVWGGTFQMAPTSSFTLSPTSACGSLTTTITNNSVGVTTYDWDFGDATTSSSANPAPHTYNTPGSYLISLVTTSATGCIDVSSQSVTVLPVPATPTASSNSPICAGSTLNLSTPLVAGATYSWTGPNGFTSTSQNPTIPSATTAATGTYSVTVTVAGCTSVAGTTAVTVNAIPATPSVSSNSPICAGSTLNLTTPVVGATYSWTGPNGFTSTSQNPTIPSATTAATGTYSLTVTVAGCTSLAGTTAVTVNAIPAAPSVSSNSPICAGSTLNLTTPVVGATYAWTGPNGFTSTSQNPTIPSATTAATGTYSLTVTIAGCTSVAGTTAVTVNPIPATPTLSSNSPICAGSTLNLSTPVVGATYSWTGPNGFTSTSQNPTIPSATTAATGTYSLTVTVAGCTSLAGTTAVTVNAIPATPSVSSNSPICAGSTLNLSTPVVGATYSWTGPNGFTSTSQNPTIPSATTAATGTYSLTVTVAGCTSLAGTTAVTVNAIPATPTLSSNSPICEGSTLNLSTPVVGATYSWTGPNGFTSTSQNPTIPSATTVATGTYSLTVTVAGCTSAAGTTAVTVNALPVATAGSNSPLCIGSTLNLTGNNIPGATYSWTGPNGFVSVLEDPSISNVTVLEDGVYSLVITLNGCSSLVSNTTVVISSGVSPVISPAGPLCSGDPAVTLTADIPGGTWTGTGITDGTLGTFDPSISGAGSFVITYTTSGACSGVDNETIIVYPNSGPPPVASQFNTASDGAGNTLPGGSNDLNWEVSTALAGPYNPAVVMTPIPGSYYNSPWPDAGWIAHIVTGSHAGNVDYYYRMNLDLPCFNQCGLSYGDSAIFCLTMDFFCDNSINEIYVNGIPQSPNQPLIPVPGQYMNIGFDAAGGLTVTLCSDWQAGPNELIVKVSSGGPFQGFLAQYSTSTVPNPDDPTITAPGNDTIFCSNDPITTLTAASTGGTWSSNCGTCIDASTGDFDPSVAGAGTFEIYYTTNSACPNSDTIEVVVNPFVDASISASVGPFCLNDAADTLTALNAGGVWSGNGITNATLGIFNPTTAGAGTHQIIYTQPGTCPDSDTVTIVVNPIPTANAGIDTIIGCVPPTVVLNGTGSSAGATYTWSTTDGAIISGGNGLTPTVGSAGTYTLTVSLNGCVSSDAVLVNDSPTLVASFSVNPSSGFVPLTVNTTNNSSGNGLVYLWDDGDDSTFNTFEPSFQYDSTGTYTITLIAADQYGCVDTAMVTVIVYDEFQIIIPNVFTPNGDGANDVFEVFSIGIKDLSAAIYNRWGQFLYSWDGVNGSWNGQYDGSEVPDGVYFYIITVTKANDEVEVFNGHVTKFKQK